MALKTGRGIPLGKLACVAGGAFVVATAAFSTLLVLGLSLTWLLVCVSAAYLGISLFAMLQLLALPSRRVPPVPADSGLSATVIIAAYLPNEQHIIVETVMHMLTRVARPRAGFEVILAYNTPRPLPVEQTLKEIETRFPEFRAVRVPHSRSKAANLNAVLNQAHGQIVALFDADHLPAADCLLRGARHIALGHDCVQGRCVVRNTAESAGAAIVAMEFDAMYAVGHASWARATGLGLFCGTNAVWRASSLRKLRFDPYMQTEDIDASVRAWLCGMRITYDTAMQSTELATATLTAFWHQRVRWARGWLEVTLRQQLDVLRADMPLARRASLTFLLGVRELNAWLSLSLFPLLAAYGLTGTYDAGPIQWFFWVSFAATQLAGPLHTFAAWRRRGVKLGAWSWLGYGLLAPLYTLLKTAISIVAAWDVFAGKRMAWVVTPRSAPAGSHTGAARPTAPAGFAITPDSAGSARRLTGTVRSRIRTGRLLATPDAPPSPDVLVPQVR
ncbi:MAG: glycosyltransferase family 2 protein [Planctomycetes bacterium]|nr:glycosyltransferase family 2 protein [Planctomycetota bacterium]MCL4731266.1 glycosyltransferase family 2 protein [Planctomycetota bacterium]